ncbi:thioredoxin domain-containing protein [Litoreibacter arenae]|uniref:Regulatory protein SoxS n=1 Tax=Litoreibacter arenae DSM 19593 TaxID=1123360 RepID=S9RG24_9RHOB|nr:Regulatory protein SoxS [Litoreibacter arenae]EPX77040.1 Regulatory protein SoxS [Litoreibacter arenae DSM 19593]
MISARNGLLGILLSGVTAFMVQAAELVMVEQDGCHWCAQWNEEISATYPKTEEGQRAPLRRVDLRDLPDDITFKSKPVFTPTFVLVDEGQELARMEGYAGDQFFWFLLGKMLDEHPDATGLDP